MTDRTFEIPPLAAQIVTAAVRHVLTVLAGSLVTWGVLDPGNQAQFISILAGIAVGAVGLAWSWISTHLKRNELKAAIEAPAAKVVVK